MKAILSDVHGNAEALTAVMADIKRRGVEEIICLGDIVGYGPDPETCTDLIAERCRTVICGNHDWAVIHSAVGFNRVAKKAIDVTRKRLQPEEGDAPEKHRRWEFIRKLPMSYREGGDIFVHGSPRDPTMEYVFPYDVMVCPNVKLEEIFAAFDRMCFVGHTHVPGVITQAYEFFDIQAIDHAYERGAEKILVNVGSVGQPRDGDNRAAYATLEGDVVRFHRVEYDYAATIRKIREITDLDELCGLRLERGE